MWSWEHSPDRSGETMDGAKTRVGQSHATKKAGRGHVGARGRGVRAFLEGHAQRTRHSSDAIHANGIGHRIGAGTYKGFEQLRQGIKPSAGCDGWGQIISE